MKVTVTFYTDDLMLCAAIAEQVRSGTQPSRVTRKQIKERCIDWFDSYGNSASCESDLAIDDLTDDEWDMAHRVQQRLGLRAH